MTVTVEERGDECPTCGEVYESFKGVCQHHRKTHDEQIHLEIGCYHCNRTFSEKPGDIHPEAQRHFCSEECRYSWLSEHKSDRVAVDCEVCGVDVQKKPSHVDRVEHHFCSQECHKEWQSDNICGEEHHRYNKAKISCAQCGKEIRRPKGYVEKYDNIFCSANCRSMWMSQNQRGSNHPNWVEREVTECEYCEAEFKHYPNADRIYCSNSCKSKDATGEEAPNWKGGVATYGDGWSNERKEAVRERDGYCCQDCGMTKQQHQQQYGASLHVHHIIPAREIEDPKDRNAIENLVTLCASCHQEKWEQIPGLSPDRRAESG